MLLPSSPLIGNIGEIVSMLETEVKLKDLEVVEGFNDLAPEEQLVYFQSGGLIISTFGTSMIFSMFSQVS